jgi:hypothetical protein
MFAYKQSRLPATVFALCPRVSRPSVARKEKRGTVEALASETGYLPGTLAGAGHTEELHAGRSLPTGRQRTSEASPLTLKTGGMTYSNKGGNFFTSFVHVASRERYYLGIDSRADTSGQSLLLPAALASGNFALLQLGGVSTRNASKR